jgi:mannose-6-phosphate isomerase-like protein (cupin superfamily)
VYGASGARIDLDKEAARLLAQLTPEVHAANASLVTTETSSYYLFATNRTETCHYHPGETISRQLLGGGQFYTDYSQPIPQAEGDSFIIPPKAPHAFDGSLHGPSVVLVRWTPPYKEPYIIPTTGCRGLPAQPVEA